MDLRVFITLHLSIPLKYNDIACYMLVRGDHCVGYWVFMDMMLFQENEQRRLQEEKMERRRKAQAEMKTKRSGKTAFFFLA